jgi:hypothetical protein
MTNATCVENCEFCGKNNTIPQENVTTTGKYKNASGKLIDIPNIFNK